jgi:putative aldouronate transport system substrate-binding protein
VRWYDYFYSEEGALLANYGFVGDTFEYLDGVPTFTEVMYKDKENRSINTMELLNVASAVQPMLYDYRRDVLVPGTSAEVMDACFRWDESADGTWSMPLISLTAEESEKFTAAFNDMDTFVKENVIKFIIGERSLSEWDDYVTELKAIGEQTVVDIMKAAVERYNHRLDKYKK